MILGEWYQSYWLLPLEFLTELFLFHTAVVWQAQLPWPAPEPGTAKLRPLFASQVCPVSGKIFTACLPTKCVLDLGILWQYSVAVNNASEECVAYGGEVKVQD